MICLLRGISKFRDYNDFLMEVGQKKKWLLHMCGDADIFLIHSHCFTRPVAQPRAGDWGSSFCWGGLKSSHYCHHSWSPLQLAPLELPWVWSYTAMSLHMPCSLYSTPSDINGIFSKMSNLTVLTSTKHIREANKAYCTMFFYIMPLFFAAWRHHWNLSKVLLAPFPFHSSKERQHLSPTHEEVKGLQRNCWKWVLDLQIPIALA